MDAVAGNPWPSYWAGRDTQLRRGTVVAAVAAAHLLAIWFLAEQLISVSIPIQPREISFDVASLPTMIPLHPVPRPPMISPTPIVVPVPEIAIEPADSADAEFAMGADQIIAARPDPAHQNDSPSAGNLSCAAGHAAEVALHVLVRKDGTIGNANVAQSCGAAQLDELALEFAKAHWRYLPATLAGQAIDSWTTVLVRFR
jgi:TonB family protein